VCLGGAGVGGAGRRWYEKTGIRGTTFSGRSVSQFVSRNDVLKAEVLWTSETISSHCSYNSNENIKKIFRVMFPDSQIAAKFTCGSRKTSYICVFV